VPRQWNLFALSVRDGEAAHRELVGWLFSVNSEAVRAPQTTPVPLARAIAAKSPRGTACGARAAGRKKPGIRRAVRIPVASGSDAPGMGCRFARRYSETGSGTTTCTVPRGVQAFAG
jgi:hypothetical protein